MVVDFISLSGNIHIYHPQARIFLECFGISANFTRLIHTDIMSVEMEVLQQEDSDVKIARAKSRYAHYVSTADHMFVCLCV